MICFIHEGIHAVGVCKNCGKAICRDCLIDEGFAVCCSEACMAEARQLNEMNQRGKKIYGIGTTTKRNSSQAISYMIIGVFFMIIGLLFLSKIPVLTYFTCSMGLLMIGIGAFTQYRMKNLGIQV